MCSEGYASGWVGRQSEEEGCEGGTRGAPQASGGLIGLKIKLGRRIFLGV